MHEAVHTIDALADSYGMGARCVVRATGIGVTETAARTQAAEDRLRQAIIEAKEADSVSVILAQGPIPDDQSWPRPPARNHRWTGVGDHCCDVHAGQIADGCRATSALSALK